MPDVFLSLSFSFTING